MNWSPTKLLAKTSPAFAGEFCQALEELALFLLILFHKIEEEKMPTPDKDTRGEIQTNKQTRATVLMSIDTTRVLGEKNEEQGKQTNS